MEILLDTLDTPLGTLTVLERGGALCAVSFGGDALRSRFGEEATAVPARLASAARLRAYFAGDLHALDGLEVDPGGTPFQQAVWALLREIPAGETRTYGQLAARLGRPSASRAVGAANGANPVALVIPCHRVIGAGGALTGYAAGVDRKEWLLRHEGALLPLFKIGRAHV